MKNWVFNNKNKYILGEVGFKKVITRSNFSYNSKLNSNWKNNLNWNTKKIKDYLAIWVREIIHLIFRGIVKVFLGLLNIHRITVGVKKYINFKDFMVGCDKPKIKISLLYYIVNWFINLIVLFLKYYMFEECYLK